MKVCPNNSLHPTLDEAGLEGLWTPTLVPRIGYCEPSCVLCSEVCPTGAIWQITPREKGWVVGVGAKRTQPVRLGTAFYDRGRCLPWAEATECIVCEEWCPVSPKAIYVEEADVVDSVGQNQKSETAARRSQPLRGLRRLRVRVSASGAARGLCNQHRRKPLAQQPDTAQPEVRDSGQRSKSREISVFVRRLWLRCIALICLGLFLRLQEATGRSVSRQRRNGRMAEDRRYPRFRSQRSVAVHRRRFRAVHAGRGGFDFDRGLQLSDRGSRPWSMYTR